MKETGNAISEIDKCTIVLDSLNRTLGYETGLDRSCLLCSYLLLLIAENITCRKNQLVVLRLSRDDADIQLLAYPVLQLLILYEAE